MECRFSRPYVLACIRDNGATAKRNAGLVQQSIDDGIAGYKHYRGGNLEPGDLAAVQNNANRYAAVLAQTDPCAGPPGEFTQWIQGEVHDCLAGNVGATPCLPI